MKLACDNSRWHASVFSSTQEHANAKLFTIAHPRFQETCVLTFCSIVDLPMPRLSQTRRQALAVCLALPIILQPQRSVSQDKIPAHLQSALGAISANSLRGHLSFIASDLLEGRDSPSRGLDIAAEYIAAQFRRAGLEPVGGDGYFQTANWSVAAQDLRAFRLQLAFDGRTLDVGAQQVSFRLASAVDVSSSEVFKLEYGDPSALSKLTAAQMEKRVVLTEIPDFQREDISRWEELAGRQQAFLKKLNDLKAALVISLDRQSQTGSGAGNGRLIDPENRGPSNAVATLPWIRVHSAEAVRVYDTLQPGLNPGSVLLSIPAPIERPVKLRNVVGLLRGSDPVLQDSYILVTAHYDHVGSDPSREVDPIFNGANDDGSGTVVGNRTGVCPFPSQSEAQAKLGVYDCVRRRKGFAGLTLLCTTPFVSLGKDRGQPQPGGSGAHRWIGRQLQEQGCLDGI